MRSCLLVLLVAPLLACTATRLATLQGDFNDLYGTKNACEEQDASARALSCEGQEIPLYELAVSAEAAAGKARDARTRIALLRLAGVSAWQGVGRNADQLVTRVSLEGVKRCDALEERVRRQETWGAPRDCAMLVLLPALLAHDVQLENFAALQTAASCSVGEVSYRDIVDSYADSTVLFVATQKSKALGYTGSSPSVRLYVEETQKRMLCNFGKLRSSAPDVCPAESNRAAREKDRIEGELGTTIADECL